MIRNTMLALLCVVVTSTACTSVNEQLNGQIKKQADSAVGQRSAQGALPYRFQAWQVGQWAKIAIRNEEVWQLQKVSIVGKEGDAFWLEVETTDPTREQNPAIIKMQVSGYSPADPASVKSLKIGKVVLQNPGQKPMMAPPFIGPLTSGWVLSTFEIDVSKAVKSSVKVPAGTFNSAAKLRVETKWGPIEVESDTWLHSAVPIWGIVKSVSTDGDHEQRLLDFDQSGAESAIKGEVMGGRSPLGF